MDKTNAAADSGGHEVKLPEHETAPPSPVIKVVKQQVSPTSVSYKKTFLTYACVI
jgi:hypothetical protein